MAAKADEEDSDGEDTELPLTPEEHAEQAKAADKHKEECEKVRTLRACVCVCVWMSVVSACSLQVDGTMGEDNTHSTTSSTPS